MGGRKLDPQSTGDDERKLLNIVEEMSIASGVPVPDVYLLDREDGINAFAAGNSVGEAALGVTRGTIIKLDRDELQGVIAHEFSHILNGDMKLNLRLVGIIFGILVIGLVGYGIFRVAPYVADSRNDRRNERGAGAGIALALFVVGGLVWLVGSIGVFFGRWIQASVSRQREYLADASAVQFTRNPLGIRDALRKIGGTSAKATVQNRHAGEISHMWFGEAFDGLFATHPPLDKRILAVDPNWDGTMLKAEHVQPADAARRSAERRASRPQAAVGRDDFLDIFGTGVAASGMAGATPPPPPRRPVQLKANDLTDRVGKVDQAHLDFATMIVRAIPPELREAARDPRRLARPDRGDAAVGRAVDADAPGRGAGAKGPAGRRGGGAVCRAAAPPRPAGAAAAGRPLPAGASAAGPADAGQVLAGARLAHRRRRPRGAV